MVGSPGPSAMSIVMGASAGGTPPPTLGTLTLSGTLTNGTASSGTINGATAGSTIVSNVTGLTVNSGARTYIWDGTGAAATTANGLVETLSGATGSPKSNSITVASGVVAGVAATTAPTAPAVQYHPNTMTATTSGSGLAKRVTAATDLRGLANATEGTTGAGAFERTDALGRKFWRFQGAEYMNIAASLVADQRGIAVFMVMRHHRAAQASTFFSQGNVAGGTAANTGNGTLRTSVSGQLAPAVNSHSISAASVASGKEKLILGSQMQVAGVVCRPTASGGTRFILDGFGANGAQPTNSLTAIAGAELGRYPFSPGASGAWANYDLYEMLVYTGVLTDAQADAIAASIKANWGIIDKVNQLLTEGDSVTQGINEVVSGNCLGMVLSEPGEPQAAPNTWRVVNLGISGDQISNLVARRDAANSAHTMPLSGINRIALQIGRNNFATGGQTAQQAYDALVPLINTTTTGYLQRGFDVRYAVNIANGGLQATYDAYRILLKSAQFKTDTLTNTGQAYDGKLSLIDLTAITVGGATPFEFPADASDATYYQAADTTHPNILGTRTMATGGDTPANGYRASFS